MSDAIRTSLVINEIHANPVAGAAGFDTDANGTVSALDEYIEFYNTSASPLDLSGLQLWDPGVGNWFTFPAGSILGPGGYALVVIGVQTGGSLPVLGPNDLAFNAARGTAVMNNAGDNIFVYDPLADTYIGATYGTWPLIDPTDPTTWSAAPASTAGLSAFASTATQIGSGENFGPIIAGDAMQRSPDGGNSFVNNQGETPGLQNVCFAAGTRIRTPGGAVAVETLRAGDLVMTADSGPRPLVWVGVAPPLPAIGPQAPVRIAAGSLGATRDLHVSPQHRIAITGWQVALLFGTPEVLVAAQALLALPGVSQQPGGQVVYVHLMFERHEVIWAEGVRCESFHPGPQSLKALQPECRAAIAARFPEVMAQDFRRFGPTARPVLRQHEALVLIALINADQAAAGGMRAPPDALDAGGGQPATIMAISRGLSPLSRVSEIAAPSCSRLAML